MRKGVVVLLTLFIGCSLDLPPRIRDATEAEAWVAQNITYQTDLEQYGIPEYWATPKETLRSMSGDCEDRALLMAYIMNQLGTNSYIVVLERSNGFHAAVDVDGVFYLDGIGGKEVNRWSYAQALIMATINHGP